MKFLAKRKDGGAESNVTGYWLVEIKSLFSIVLLRFEGPSREAFHTHAFNCVSWLISGWLVETFRNGSGRVHMPSWRPFVTRRSDFHKVSPLNWKPAWVLSFRGPWVDRWREYRQSTSEYVTLTHGRKVVA